MQWHATPCDAVQLCGSCVCNRCPFPGFRFFCPNFFHKLRLKPTQISQNFRSHLFCGHLSPPRLKVTTFSQLSWAGCTHRAPRYVHTRVRVDMIVQTNGRAGADGLTRAQTWCVQTWGVSTRRGGREHACKGAWTGARAEADGSRREHARRSEHVLAGGALTRCAHACCNEA